jgi:hypothetical protein
MTLTRSKLRLLVERALLEGFKDDQRYLAEKHPDHAQDLESLPPKWIGWLTARFGERPKTEEIHPFEDAIVTIKSFSKRDAAIGEKYKASAQFKEAVDTAFPPSDRAWSSPADPMQMTVDEIELILGLSERKKQRFGIDESEDIEGDRIGKVGPWNLWMPTTRENSCRIAGYDPVTRDPKTTWCTARTAGSNLFYHYVGQPESKITLFYVIKDDPKAVTDRLAIGFLDGKIVMDSQHGGLSVDSSNKGLNIPRIKKIFDSYFDEILQVLTKKSASINGKHPAAEKVREAANDTEAFKRILHGLSTEEAGEIKIAIAKSPVILPEIFELLASDKDARVRISIAAKKEIPIGVLLQLLKDPNGRVRTSAVQNSSTPIEAMNEMFYDNEANIRRFVVWRGNPPPEVLKKLSRDKNSEVRISVAGKTSTPESALLTLSKDKNRSVRSITMHNPNIPAEALDIFSRNDDHHFRAGAAVHLKTSIETLARLATDPVDEVRQRVAKNPNTPAETLQALASDKDPGVRKAAANSLATRQQGLNEARLRNLIRQML